MKFLIIIVFLFSTMFAAELNWSHDYDAALAEAKKEQKDVYLFVGADVCKWCDRFKDLTLSNQGVIEKLKENYVLLYMSRDRHKIPKHFEVKGVPRHYFLTNSGKIIYKDRGSREIAGFLDMLDEVDLSKK